MRDVWLFDDETGCLGCGELRFRESAVAGLCNGCADIDYASDDWQTADDGYDTSDSDWSEFIVLSD